MVNGDALFMFMGLSYLLQIAWLPDAPKSLQFTITFSSLSSVEYSSIVGSVEDDYLLFPDFFFFFWSDNMEIKI